MLIWSFALSFMGVLGLWLAGKRMKVGWLIALANEALWLAYTIATAQWGFLIAIVVYSFVYLKNWNEWRKDDLPPKRRVSYCHPNYCDGHEV